jgi:hypothetical protein
VYFRIAENPQLAPDDFGNRRGHTSVASAVIEISGRARGIPARRTQRREASTLTGHLAHEERDGLPLIGVALSAAEWRGVGFKMARRNGMSSGGEMFAWILDGAGRDDAAASLGALPPPLRLLYRAVWKPRFDKTPRW